MVSICEERMTLIGPGIFETFDGIVVIFLTHCNHKILVLDSLSVSEGDLATIRIDLLYTDCIRMSNIFADLGSGCRCKVELGDSE